MWQKQAKKQAAHHIFDRQLIIIFTIKYVFKYAFLERVQNALFKELHLLHLGEDNFLQTWRALRAHLVLPTAKKHYVSIAIQST